LQDDWYKPRGKKVVNKKNEEFERDSLDSGDESKNPKGKLREDELKLLNN